MELNIVNLIEKNSITRLNKEYENKLINKIKENFSESEQQIFVASFYCFLNYDSKQDFIIDFDSVWKWLGFSRKDNAKRLLEKFFTINVDYVLKTAPPFGGAVCDTINGGQNKEQIMITVNTFKKFCLKAGTKKADEVHDYYIKLEELLQETVNEENDELRLQLTHKEEEKKNIENKYLKLEVNHDKLIVRHNKHLKKIKRTPYEIGNVV